MSVPTLCGPNDRIGDPGRFVQLPRSARECVRRQAVDGRQAGGAVRLTLHALEHRFAVRAQVVGRYVGNDVAPDCMVGTVSRHDVPLFVVLCAVALCNNIYRFYVGLALFMAYVLLAIRTPHVELAVHDDDAYRGTHYVQILPGAF